MRSSLTVMRLPPRRRTLACKARAGGMANCMRATKHVPSRTLPAPRSVVTSRITGGFQMPLTLESPAFSSDGTIPAKYTCDGEETSPPLEWSGVPDKAMSLALIVDDPDAPDPAAPKRRFVHWVLYNIPPDARGLSEGAARGKLPPGALEGANEFDRNGYGGTCPPHRRHRHVFTPFTLDT